MSQTSRWLLAGGVFGRSGTDRAPCWHGCPRPTARAPMPRRHGCRCPDGTWWFVSSPSHHRSPRRHIAICLHHAHTTIPRCFSVACADLSAKAPVLRRLLSHSLQIGLLETRQIRDIPRTCRGNNRWCCPIELQELVEVLLQPDRGANDPDESRVAAPPFREKTLVAQNQVNDERGPYLPPDRVLVRSVEALELKGLFQLTSSAKLVLAYPNLG